MNGLQNDLLLVNSIERMIDNMHLVGLTCTCFYRITVTPTCMGLTDKIGEAN